GGWCLCQRRHARCRRRALAAVGSHLGRMSTPAWAAAVCKGAYAAGIRDLLYVPDNPLSHIVHEFEENYRDVRLLLATREEEAFGAAGGLYLGGRKAAVMCQSSGLGNSLNVIGSLLVPYQIPVLAIVSMRGEIGEWNAAQVPMGRAARTILSAIGMPHAGREAPGSAAGTVTPAAGTAFGPRVPSGCVLPRRLTMVA